MPSFPPKQTYEPTSYVKLPPRTQTGELKVATATAPKKSSYTRSILAALGLLGGGGGGTFLAHRDDRDTRDKVIQTQADLSGHIKQSDERHSEVKASLKTLEDESKADRVRRAEETQALFDALHVPKEKRPK